MDALKEYYKEVMKPGAKWAEKHKGWFRAYLAIIFGIMFIAGWCITHFLG